LRRAEEDENMRWSFWLKVLLSIALLGIVVYLVDFRKAVDTLVNLNPWYLLPYAALYFFDRALMAYKWNILLVVLKVQVPFLILFRSCSVAPLVGMVLPATIGGDAFRVYSLARHKISAQSVLASIIVERIIGFTASLLLAAISLGLVFYLMRDQWTHLAGLGWLLLLLMTSTVVALLALQGLRRGWVRSLTARFSKYPLVNKLYAFWARFWEFRNHKGALGVVFGWTFLEQLVPVGWNFLLVKALHIDVSFLELVAVIPLIILAIRLPISFEGIGVQEGLYVGLLALVGIPPAQALILSTATRIMNALCALPWAIHYLLTRNQGAFVVPQTADIDPGQRDLAEEKSPESSVRKGGFSGLP
jgi:glycosyltransferase 2 family protein